jgi:hypothetical protein
VHDLVEAVLALSEDPGGRTVERYLAASRALEESRPKPSRRRRTPARTKAATPRPGLQERADYAA